MNASQSDCSVLNTGFYTGLNSTLSFINPSAISLSPLVVSPTYPLGDISSFGIQHNRMPICVQFLVHSILCVDGA
jgi:hypothetical protein